MDARQKHILIEKIKLLYLHSLTPAILSGIAALFLVAALWPTANHQYLIIWLATTLILAMIRVTLILRFQHQKPVGDAVLAWEKPYVISMIIVFFVWGVGLPVIVPRNDLASIFIVNTFAIGLAAAANSWYNSIRHVQISAICIALLPMITVLLTYGQPEAFWVGVAACCMFISCIFTSLILQKTLNGNLELAYDLVLAKKAAEQIASTDVLTGLNNRRAFFDKAGTLLGYCRTETLPISVIMLDIDFFKKINDEYGHAVGDKALQHVAHLLQRNLRASDVICRFGGEEFAILLPNTGDEEAAATAEKMRQLIETTPAIMHGNQPLSITASFGVSDVGDNMDELINHADEAMYKGKRSGRNVVVNYSDKANKTKAKANKSPHVRTSLLSKL
jgi:diguanylate cyclase